MLLAALARAAPPPELSTSLNPTFPSTDAVRRPIYGELAARVNGTFGVDYPEARLARALRWRGSDTRLRTALAAAAKNPNRTFVALVLGGSEAAGAQCESEVPGVRRLGLFAYWKQPGRQGGRKSRPDCAWPARLARYLATVLPNLNFLVVDGAFPGSDTQFSLTTLKSHQLKPFSGDGPAPVSKLGAATPIIDALDLVLIDHTANDLQQPPDYNVAALRALLARYEQLNVATAVVEAALPKTCYYNGCGKTGGRPAGLWATHVAAANESNTTVVDATDFAGAGPPEYAVGLKQAFVGRAFGHFAEDMHEWTAATVFYGLVAPAVRAGAPDAAAAVAARPVPRACDPSLGAHALALCHLARQPAATQYDFAQTACTDVSGCPGRAVAAGRWAWGEDVPGKAGWVTCDGDVNSTLSADLDCDQGDLLVVYLQSYDRRMGRTQVKATPLSGGEARSLVLDSWTPDKKHSVTATAALTLSRGHYRISLRPLPRASEASPPAKLAPCGAGFLGTRACCNRDKFKLLVLECT